MKGSNGLFAKSMHQYRVSQWELPIFLSLLRKESTIFFSDRSSFHFKNELWFPTKRWVQMVSLQNKHINIMYPSGNYPFPLVRHENKLDSWHKWSSFRFKDEFWFPTKQRVQMVSSSNQCINIVYANGNYPFLLIWLEKNLDSCRDRSSFHFKDEYWFPIKWWVQMVSSWN